MASNGRSFNFEIDCQDKNTENVDNSQSKLYTLRIKHELINTQTTVNLIFIIITYAR